MNTNPSDPNLQSVKSRSVILLLSTSIIAICALVYELGIGSLSSYLRGNSVYQFSITIGLFMTALGIGSYLSKYFTQRLMTAFISVELAIGFIGGFSCPLLFAAYSFKLFYAPMMWGLIILIGTLTGLELPLLTRIFREYTPLRIALANVLTFDYLGGLIGALAFPLLLLPVVGIFDISMVMGLANLAVVFVNLVLFRREIRHLKLIWFISVLTAIGLAAGLIVSNPVGGYLEQRIYADKIILSKASKYQRIVLTRWRDDIRLFINGRLQFSAMDEHRYHEALVHPAASLISPRSEILVLGGGDGLAVREILKYSDVNAVTVVDIDPMITNLARTDSIFRQLNRDALHNPKVQVINRDAKQFLQTTDKRYNLIVIDLPDPDDEGLVSLYSREFYELVKRRLTRDGLAVTQSSSPFFARQAFWCIHQTIESAGLHAIPYHVYVPSFGEWGFNMFAAWRPNPDEISITVPTRFLSEASIAAVFTFDKDMQEIETKINTLLAPILMRYHRSGWKSWGL